MVPTQTAFGGNSGHTIDLMALPLNVMHDLSGKPLPFFSPHPTPGCLGVNIFSQLPRHHRLHVFANPYVFSPICLIPKVLRFLCTTVGTFMIVIPDVQPRHFWWPILKAIAFSNLCLGRKSETGITLPPSDIGLTPNGHSPGICGLSAFITFAESSPPYG